MKHTAHWRPLTQWRRAEIPKNLRTWLFDSSSMTKHMQCVCEQVQVTVVQQHSQSIASEEAQLLAMPTRKFASVREVIMQCDQQPWLFGRAIIPLNILAGKHRRLAHLGTTSLGSVLFKDPSMQRTPFELAKLAPHHVEFQQALQAMPFTADQLWARRSKFIVRGKPLLLKEVFLPAMLDFLHQ